MDLHKAIIARDLSKAHELAKEAGKDINEVDADYYTPLALAVELLPELISDLVEKYRANVNPTGSILPLNLAICLHQVDVIQYLMNHGADPHCPDLNGNSAFKLIEDSPGAFGDYLSLLEKKTTSLTVNTISLSDAGLTEDLSAHP